MLSRLVLMQIGAVLLSLRRLLQIFFGLWVIFFWTRRSTNSLKCKKNIWLMTTFCPCWGEDCEKVFWNACCWSFFQRNHLPDVRRIASVCRIARMNLCFFLSTIIPDPGSCLFESKWRVAWKIIYKGYCKSVTYSPNMDGTSYPSLISDPHWASSTHNSQQDYLYKQSFSYIPQNTDLLFILIYKALIMIRLGHLQILS